MTEISVISNVLDACNVLAVSLSIDIIARFVCLSSVTIDLWNVLISLNLLKLHSAVLRTAVIGKLSLGRVRRNFSRRGGNVDIFAYAFQVSVDAM